MSISILHMSYRKKATRSIFVLMRKRDRNVTRKWIERHSIARSDPSKTTFGTRKRQLKRISRQSYPPPMLRWPRRCSRLVVGEGNARGKSGLYKAKKATHRAAKGDLHADSGDPLPPLTLVSMHWTGPCAFPLKETKLSWQAWATRLVPSAHLVNTMNQAGPLRRGRHLGGSHLPPPPNGAIGVGRVK